MIRDTSAANSAFAYVEVSPGGTVRFQWRTTAGGSSSATTVTGLSGSIWVKLVRSGNSFSGYYSTDGSTWIQIGTTRTIAMGTGLGGLAVSSQNASNTSTATFANVFVSTMHTGTLPADPYTGLDNFGRVVGETFLNLNTGEISDEFQYGYDADGSVLFKNNLVNSSESELYHANSTTTGDDNSAYDALSRLVDFQRGTLSSSGNNGSSLDTVATASNTQDWTLDALGNAQQITTNGTTQDRTTNSQNELTTVGSNSLSYDNNGNTITDDQGHTLVYDAWNRLVSVSNGSAVLKSYTYDGANRRVTETDGSTSITTSLFYSSQWQVLEERQNGQTTAQYIWSHAYVDALVLRDSAVTGIGGNLGKSGSGLSQRLYTQQDANYNVVALVNTNGQVVERYLYDPYGKVTVLNPDWSAKLGNTSSFGWQYLHQGGRFDVTTGLYIFRNRDYSVTMQRWMQQDPLGYINGANVYNAFGDSPLTLRDPLGLCDTGPTVSPQSAEQLRQQIVGVDKLLEKPHALGFLVLGEIAATGYEVCIDGPARLLAKPAKVDMSKTPTGWRVVWDNFVKLWNE